MHEPKDPALIAKMASDPEVIEARRRLFELSCRYRYSYNFSWLGRPIIQYPEDLMVMQELIWRVQPDLIVETGVAHGGSLVFHASMLELLGKPGLVVGVDIEIRPHNRTALEEHRLFHRMKLIEGSSIDPDVVSQVAKFASSSDRVLVVLDSNHSHKHVLAELEAYSPLVSKGSYLVVLDTVVEDTPPELIGNRPWAKGNNPKTAVHQFLRTNQRFEVDREIESKILMTVAPDGFLQCIRD